MAAFLVADEFVHFLQLKVQWDLLKFLTLATLVVVVAASTKPAMQLHWQALSDAAAGSLAAGPAREILLSLVPCESVHLE